MAQLAIDFARLRRDDGIERAADHAGQAWQRSARGYLLEFLAIRLKRHDQFLAEDVREFAEKRGITDPPDGRAWGHVLRSAARENIIRKVGYAPARSSNLSPKVLWEGT